jgi:hypothetical protein
MRQRKTKTLCWIILGAGFWAAGLTASPAQNAAGHSSPTFGSRTDKPDGSVALQVGRRLPTEWESRIGVDASLPADAPVNSAAMSGIGAGRSSSGAAWGSVSGPGLVPLIFDQTAIDARVDSGEAHGKIGATLSRTVPLGDNFSVILRDKYSLTQSLHGDGATGPNQEAPNATPSSAWNIDRSISFKFGSTGTTLSAGRATSSDDTQWHHRLSAEQQVIGPLSVTTSVTDPGSAGSNKSIGASFKRTW